MPFSENMAIFIYFLLFSFILGSIVGSFLNVVVWRLPRGESLCHPPSHCPKCGHFIRPWENIPILSWLFLRGRCSSCQLAISWRYPAGEAAVGLLFAGIYLRVFHSELPLAVLPGYFWLAASVLAAALIDAEHRIIPNKITYSGMIVAFLLALFLPQSHLVLSREPGLIMNSVIFQAASEMLGQWHPLEKILCLPAATAAFDCLLGIFVAGGILTLFAWAGKRLLRQQKPELEAIGLGDAKFLAMIAAFLGSDAAIYILLGGALLGFLSGIVILIRKKGPGKCFSSLPFAPFLAVPALGWLLFGNWINFIRQFFFT